MILKLLTQTTVLLAATVYVRCSFQRLNLLALKEQNLSLSKRRLILIMLAVTYLGSCVAIGAMLGELWRPIMQDLISNATGTV